jgi:WD repeat-containing protein 48
MSNAWGKVQGSAHVDPIHKQPSATIKSTPPIVEHKQTSDRLHVLAKDTDGAISLWDVVKCERVKRWDAGGDDLFAEVLKDVNPRVSVPSWFTVDTRTGSIAVSLMPSGAFQAEAYALDMGVDGANDELKCNYGVQTIHMLLRGWKARRLRAMACEAGRELSSDEDDDSHLDFDVNALTPCGDAKVWRLPSRPPSLVCEQRDGEGAALMPVGEMAGSAEEHQALPEWIVEVLSEKYR